jgi:hypothetical protein
LALGTIPDYNKMGLPEYFAIAVMEYFGGGVFRTLDWRG